MSTILATTLIGGIILGVFMARASNRRTQVRSGALGQLFHYVAAVAITGIPIAVLTGLFTGQLGRGVLTGLGALAVCALSLLVYAAIEHRAIAASGQ